jgi:hypothetical protein
MSSFFIQRSIAAWVTSSYDHPQTCATMPKAARMSDRRLSASSPKYLSISKIVAEWCMTLDRAIEVFVHGFAFTRSFTHPYLAERLQSAVWVLRDAPRTRGDYRGEEYVATNINTTELDALAQQHTRGRFKLCVIRDATESDIAIRAAFRILGYRLLGTEPFMLHRLAALETVPESYPVVRVTTRAEAQLLAQAARSRQILPEHLAAGPAPMRQYIAMEQYRLGGWAVSSWAITRGARICSSSRRTGGKASHGRCSRACSLMTEPLAHRRTSSCPVILAPSSTQQSATT